MKEAWRVTCVDKMSTEGRSIRRQGGAVALWDLLEKLGWAAPAYDVFKTCDGLLLSFGPEKAQEGLLEVDLALVRKMLSTRRPTMRRERERPVKFPK